MLQENQIAPDFELPLLHDGVTRFYDDARLSVLIFYKYSCPTCQLAMPYLQRIFEAYGDALQFLAIAQDPGEPTVTFQEQYGISMPTLLDMTPYTVSRKYDIGTVPTIFLVSPDRSIRFSGEGFVKQEILNLADVLAEKTGRAQIDVFGNDPVPEIKPG